MAATTESSKLLSDNRQAGHNFFLFDRYEAGMVLTGTEVKAAKSGKVQLRDAYAMIDEQRSLAAQRPYQRIQPRQPRQPPARRARKLLLHRREIEKLLTRHPRKRPLAGPDPHVPQERQDKMRDSARQGQEVSRQAGSGARQRATKPKPATPSAPAKSASSS